MNGEAKMVDQATFDALVDMLNQHQRENELPLEIKNCETDLLMDLLPTFVNMDNFINYPIAHVKCSRNVFESFTVIVLDAFREFKQGDKVYAVENENLFKGEIIKLESYQSRANLPFNPGHIIFPPKGRVVQPPRQPELSFFTRGPDFAYSYYDPFVFDYSQYGSIAEDGFSVFDPAIHSNDSFSPTVTPRNTSDPIKKLVIPENIRILGQRSFAYRSDIDEVYISNEKTIILDSAFSFCGNLKYVALPEKTVIIHNGCFYKCYSLTESFIPTSVRAIEAYAFCECISLRKVLFMPCSKLEIIGTGAFEKTDLEIIDLRVCSNLKEIKSNAFKDCKRLKEVRLRGNVRIHKCAFYGCPNVKVFGVEERICEEYWDLIDVDDQDNPIRLKR